MIVLGIGLWQRDPASRNYAQTLRARGTPGGVIACALAHRANKIAFAMARHHDRYDEPFGVTSLLDWCPAFCHGWSSDDAR